jgi:hypothetical protein
MPRRRVDADVLVVRAHRANGADTASRGARDLRAYNGETAAPSAVLVSSRRVTRFAIGQLTGRLYGRR